MLEARLKTLGFTSYTSYLSSAHWINLSSRLRDTYRRCQACNSLIGLQVHHRTYENLGNEPDQDLCVLCAWCHSEIHRIAKLIGDLDRATDIVLAKNGKETIEQYLSRGGEITRIPQPQAPPEIESDSYSDSDDPPSGCVCCGRLSGHRHWCIYNPLVGPPIDDDDEEDAIYFAEKSPVKPKLTIQSKLRLRLCLNCGNEIVKPRRGFSRFHCSSCRAK